MGTERNDDERRIGDAIRSAAHDPSPLDAPPANLWGRIERAVDDADDGTGPAVPPDDLWDRIADDVRTDPDAAAPTSMPVPVSAAPRRRRSVLLAAAAVAVVLALAAGVVAVSRDGDPATELVATASLSGAGLDPGGDGTGSAELLEGPKGWKVAIEVADLPELPDGSYYEAWLLGSGPGQVQSLGALRGDERFAVPDGLAIDDFPLVDVSIEPIDGNPEHSSRSVLRGELEKT